MIGQFLNFIPRNPISPLKEATARSYTVEVHQYSIPTNLFETIGSSSDMHDVVKRSPRNFRCLPILIFPVGNIHVGSVYFSELSHSDHSFPGIIGLLHREDRLSAKRAMSISTVSTNGVVRILPITSGFINDKTMTAPTIRSSTLIFSGAFSRRG
jgi:hypothetical protein